MQAKRFLAAVLAAVMLVAMMPTALAVDYPDTADHWASAQIAKWSDYGVLKGNDGVFRPDANITRGEMAVILDRLMVYQTKSTNSFADLDNSWYTDSMLKANAAGIIKGGDGAIRPKDNITRQEAAVMLCRALGIAEVTGDTNFADNASIATWAKGAMKAMSAKGLITGVGENRVAPTDNITRASVVKMLDNAIKSFYNKEGEYTANVTGTVVINTPNVTLKNMTVTGDLIIAEGVGEGDVTLNSVTVTGNTIVRGGGSNTVKATGDTKLENVRMEKLNGDVRIVTTGNAVLKNVLVNGGTGKNIIEGKANKVTVATGSPVTLNNAKVQELAVEASNANIVVGKNTVVDKATVTGTGNTISGEGKVTNATVSGNNTSFDVVGTNLTVDSNVTGTTVNDKAVSGGTSGTTKAEGGVTPPATGGSGGGGSWTPSLYIEKAVWSNTSTPNAAQVNEMMTALWGTTTSTVQGIEVKPVLSASGSTLTVNKPNVSEGLLQWIKTQWGGSSIPVKLSGTTSGATGDANWGGAVLAWVDFNTVINGPVEIKLSNNTVVVMNVVVTNTETVSKIDKPVWSNTATPNAAQVNEMMTALWANTASTVQGIEIKPVFHATGRTLAINELNVSQGLLDWVKTQWGGSSVPVALTVSTNLPGAVGDANWNGAILAWVDLDTLENGRIVAELSNGATAVINTAVVGTETVSKIEKAVWSNAATPNADKVNKMMTAMWATAPSTVDGIEVKPIFSTTGNTLTVNKDHATQGVLDWVKAQWGGSSVPVALTVSTNLPGAVGDANWGSAILAWVDLAAVTKGELEVELSNFTVTQINVVVSGNETVSAIAAPVWNAATPNADKVNKMMTAMWATAPSTVDGIEVKPIFSTTGNTLTVNKDHATQGVLDWVKAQWGGSSIPVALTVSTNHVGAVGDANWSNAKLAWIDLATVASGEMNITLSNDTITSIKIVVTP